MVPPGIAPERLPPALRGLHDAARFVVIEDGGTPVHWRLWGERGPIIVLLHGGFGSWMHWAGNIRALAMRHRVMVCDIPGYGGTPPVPDPTGMVEIARPIATTLRHMIGDQPHLLCGFSFGAMVAGFLAPLSGATQLVTLGAPNCGPTPDRLAGMQSWRQLPRTERQAAHANNLRVLMLHRPESLDATAIRIQALCAESAIADYRAIARSSDADAALQACNCPLLAIWGAEDVLVRSHLAARRRFIAALGPRAEIAIWPGLGHWLAWEDPARVNLLLETMAARHR